MKKRTLAVPSGLAGLALLSLAAPSLLPSLAPAPLVAGPTPIDTLPFLISTPGSYCLTGNLTAGPGVTGIRVEADFVTIDLGGFVLDGADEPVTAIYGNGSRLLVRNGTVEHWGVGIRGGGRAEITDVTVSRCDEEGASVGFGSKVRDCLFEDNGDSDPGDFNLRANPYSSVENCTFIASDTEVSVVLDDFVEARGLQISGGDTCLKIGNGVLLEGCLVVGYKSVGIDAGAGSSIDRCNVYSSYTVQDFGIRGLERTRISNCSVMGPNLTGILVESFSTVVDSSVSESAGDGIRVGMSSRVVDCVVSACNANLAGLGGIVAGPGSLVKSCTSSNNTGTGILIPLNGGVVSDCVAFENSMAGITQGTAGWTKSNWAVGNQAEGLLMTGDSHSIEDNVADLNQRGIVLDGRFSLVKGNRAAKNTLSDFTIPWGNPTGPINHNAGTIQGSVPQANFKTPY